jgi:hypothetical protein
MSCVTKYDWEVAEESGGFALDLKNVILGDREAVKPLLSARPTERNSRIVRLIS